MKAISELNIYFRPLLQTFAEKFLPYKEKKIVLYGIGAFSAAVIEFLEDYNIIGLMDRDPGNIGRILYGVPIISKAQAETTADLIVINTEEAYWQTIYKRIYDLKIDIYYRNGQKAYLDTQPECDASLDYWNSSRQELIRKIDTKAVISFDIFDTLVTRKVYLPADVFQLVELRLKYGLNIAVNFSELRIKALHTTGKAEPNYDEIYKQFQQLSDLNPQTTKEIKRLEFETEKHLLIPRKDMVEILQYAKQQKKKVILISDMYYSSEQLKELLDAVGILEYDEIFVSCEYRKNKLEGLLYDEVLKRYDKKSLLHIGDNRQSDYEMALKKQIDAFYVMSGRDLLANCSIKGIIPKICTIMDSLITGIITADIFNSPFALHESHGTVYFKEAKEMGFSVFAPLIWGFTHWLRKSTLKDKVEKLLFFSRDGYFLKDYFQQLQDFCKNDPPVESEYFMISRRLAAVASICDQETFLEVARLPYKGSFAEYMERRWNVQICPEDEWFHHELNTSIHFEEVFNHMMVYREELKQSILKDKRNYGVYCQQHTAGKNTAIVDTWYYGNCQWYFSQILKHPVQGYYFGVNLSDSNRNAAYNILSACYNNKENSFCKDVQCLKYSLHFESIFTAPHGMVRSQEDNGNFLYEQEGKNQQEFRLREEIDAGVRRFIDELTELLGQPLINQAEFDYQFCDQWYGILVKGMRLSKEIQSKLYNENYFQSNEEFLIIED